MNTPFECEGAPRDLGLDQGRACRDALRAQCTDTSWRRLESLRLSERGRDRRVLRDVRRHFPQQAEQLEGLARGAGVSVRRLARASWNALASTSRGSSLALACGGASLLARSLPPDARARRTRPEGRYRSVELTLPALTHPILGVNEAGLAVACHAGPARIAACAAPAALLARDCLERFSAVESALRWCLERPAAPRAALLLVDAGGAAAALEIADRVRDVRRPSGGVLASGASPVSMAALSERFADAALEPAAAAQVLAASFDPPPPPFAFADPVGRRIWIPGAEAGWLEL